MPTPFLSSEEYDERAHKQYDRGDYDAALATLKEGLKLYPHSVELYVGLGYTRLAREEFAWALQAFEKALVLDPEHDDGMVGYGEALLRFGRHDEAARLFERVRIGPSGQDPELLLSMGRAFYREGRFEDARDCFTRAVEAEPDDPEATAALGFTLHRLAEEDEAIGRLRSAIGLNPDHLEARVYLAHLLYDRADWEGALTEFAALTPAEHWDPLAVWRLVELKKSVGGLDASDPELLIWETRLDELENDTDPIDEILAEIEMAAMAKEPDAWGPAPRAPGSVPQRGLHRIRLPDGRVFEGSWMDIVRQLRDQAGRADESIAQFMRRWAEDTRVRIGVGVPVDDAEGFLLAHARAGLLQIER
ncbi:MAG: tetratricopeptide repeat protein [Gemmatimonadetes bacterium]|nr:tetratricopeptide repeat protein [Gemmatimonadota bacterium]NIQ58035.1 tetratricopeptide repeat protein [Gemmatimonadota bacterium]NIU78218.1 tetratricopeptide repeat protein [Gammaproteobacteria bacterium]NIX47207.1 tetratricopeptide repeat protein [Gemmatimonadota bacterium]NIY11583.1 tetratricopeptide repeat protein [Gemmatimonadota bacterium]